MQTAQWTSERRVARLLSGVALVLASLAPGCMERGEEPIDAVGLASGTPLPRREGTVLVDGCSLDPWQDTTLALPATRVVVSEVLFLCLVPRDDGTLGPADAFARERLAFALGEVKKRGYRASLGVAFTDETGTRYDGARIARLVSSPTFRERMIASLEEVAKGADAVDLDLQNAPTSSRADLTTLVAAVSKKLRPSGKKLGVMLPPSVSDPSDLPGGEAFDRRALAPYVDRFRVMTLDYSESGGPTIDTGWAVDAVRLAQTSGAPCFVSVPLYGVDFGPRGARGVSVLEARGLASSYGASPRRSATTTLTFAYVSQGEAHEVWFDDAESTGAMLGAFASALPPEVGVLYYGFGAEDPRLFDTIAERTR